MKVHTWEYAVSKKKRTDDLSKSAPGVVTKGPDGITLDQFIGEDRSTIEALFASANVQYWGREQATGVFFGQFSHPISMTSAWIKKIRGLEHFKSMTFLNNDGHTLIGVDSGWCTYVLKTDDPKPESKKPQKAQNAKTEASRSPAPPSKLSKALVFAALLLASMAMTYWIAGFDSWGRQIALAFIVPIAAIAASAYVKSGRYDGAKLLFMLGFAAPLLMPSLRDARRQVFDISSGERFKRQDQAIGYRIVDAVPDTAHAAHGSVSSFAAGGKTGSTNRTFYALMPLKHADALSPAKIWVLYSSGSPFDADDYFNKHWTKLVEQPPPGPSGDFEYVREQTKLPSTALDPDLVVLRATDDLSSAHPILLTLAVLYGVLVILSGWLVEWQKPQVAAVGSP